MRAWPFPYMKLMHPFLIGGAVTLFAFSKIQNSMCECKYHTPPPMKFALPLDWIALLNNITFFSIVAEVYANDPKNPKYAEIQARKHKAEGH
ncbi:hypothetical protein LPJ60_002639 [Coemansia sp. RSA 2675]|nr:hypothetical protein LPJ60_002639 [Coemansia sp. RSA 2675]